MLGGADVLLPVGGLPALLEAHKKDVSKRGPLGRLSTVPGVLERLIGVDSPA
jgi:hypothetical protein